MHAEDLHLRVTREIPFGEYKERPIADLPDNYLNGFACKNLAPGGIGRLLTPLRCGRTA